MEIGLSAGLLVAERYHLDRIVGEGGMGSVWAATNITTGRSVALKFPKRPAPRGSPRYEKFLAEARATIDHPHVVRIHDVLHLSEDVPFLVMELLRGRTLRQDLRHGRRLSSGAVVTTFRQVISAVACAHAVGVIHRDLKPENIFLTTTEEGTTIAKVLDFGVACRVPRRRTLWPAAGGDPGGAQGTLGYAAPEQAVRGEIDPRGDIWSLGVVLHECLTGEQPFRSESWVEYMRSCEAGPAPSVKVAAPEVPDEVADIIQQMLSLDPAARPDLRRISYVLGLLGDVRGLGSDPPLPAALDESAFALQSTPSARSTTRPSNEPPSQQVEHLSASGELLTPSHTVTLPGASRRRNMARWRDVSAGVAAAALALLAWQGHRQSEPLRPDRPSTAAAQASRSNEDGATEETRPVASAPPSQQQPIVTLAPPTATSTFAYYSVTIVPPDALAEVDGKRVKVNGGTIVLARLPKHVYALRIWKGESERLIDLDADPRGAGPQVVSLREAPRGERRVTAAPSSPAAAASTFAPPRPLPPEVKTDFE